MSNSAELLTLPLSRSSPLSPDPVLRVGYAGRRQLDHDQSETIAARPREVISVIGWHAAEIAPMDDSENDRPVPSIARFHALKRPTLRLNHGFCEGADTIACDGFQQMVMAVLEKDSAAVVPFPATDYRASRDPDFLSGFDKQQNTSPGGACRCQSAPLLRQSALLFAVVNPDLEGKPGGTLETVRSALDFDLPIVPVQPDTGGTRPGKERLLGMAPRKIS